MAMTDKVSVLGENELERLVKAAQESLIVISAWKITDDANPYREVGEGMRTAFREAHDLLLAALPMSNVFVEAVTKRLEGNSVREGG